MEKSNPVRGVFVGVSVPIQETAARSHTYAPSFGTTIMDPRRVCGITLPEDLPEEPLCETPVKVDLLDSIYGDYEARIRKRLVVLFCLHKPTIDDTLSAENINRVAALIKAVQADTGTNSVPTYNRAPFF